MSKKKISISMDNTELPEAHYGSISDKPIDWRASKDETPDDDEQLDKTPDDVVELLGFDPAELENV